MTFSVGRLRASYSPIFSLLTFLKLHSLYWIPEPYLRTLRKTLPEVTFGKKNQCYYVLWWGFFEDSPVPKFPTIGEKVHPVATVSFKDGVIFGSRKGLGRTESGTGIQSRQNLMDILGEKKATNKCLHLVSGKENYPLGGREDGRQFISCSDTVDYPPP